MRTLCLSIQQPWADLSVYGARDSRGDVVRKDIENRTWRPGRDVTLPCRLVIHASAKQVRNEYLAAGLICRDLNINPVPSFQCPCRGGGVIGVTDLVRIDQPGNDVMASPWRDPNQYGWCLANPRPLPFYACRGTLGLWPPTPEILALLDLPSPESPAVAPSPTCHGVATGEAGTATANLPGWAERV